jgi:DNA repair photolyase
MGKAIYKPKGKAGEYAMYACNFYNGCSNECEYCYLKKGVLKGTMGGNKPTLKKCFVNESNAIAVFEKELMQNLSELQKHGLFFSFSTDPMLPETISLTFDAIEICLNYNIPVKVLTKRSDWWSMWYARSNIFINKQHLVAFGFTLTGHDELEPKASSNDNRIDLMKKLHTAGFKTFASIEPVVDWIESMRMIGRTIGFCELYKIGLMSGEKYDKAECLASIHWIIEKVGNGAKIYFKDSLLKQAGIDRSDLPVNCVDRNYNLFENE